MELKVTDVAGLQGKHSGNPHPPPNVTVSEDL